MTERTAKARSGKIVTLNSMTRVSAAEIGYVLDARDFAVSVFIPGD